MAKDSGRLRTVFDLFDLDGNGEIAVAELGQVLRLLRLDVEDQDLERMMGDFVKSDCGILQFDDFARMMEIFEFGEEDLQPVEESDLREAFRVFDENGDGYISDTELQSVLGKLGLSEGRNIDRVREMICAVDVNRDGRVDFKEFKLMMRDITLQSS